MRRKATTRKSRLLMLFQIGFVVVIVGALVGSLSINMAHPGRPGNDGDTLGSLQLIGTVRGDEARDRLESLNAAGLDLQEAYMVEYVSGSQRGTVWVGSASDGSSAAEITDRMLQAVRNAGDTFGEPEQITVAGQAIHAVRTAGAEHFFYRSGLADDRVVWLETNAADVLSVVRDAVQKY